MTWSQAQHFFLFFFIIIGRVSVRPINKKDKRNVRVNRPWAKALILWMIGLFRGTLRVSIAQFSFSFLLLPHNKGEGGKKENYTQWQGTYYFVVMAASEGFQFHWSGHKNHKIPFSSFLFSLPDLWLAHNLFISFILLLCVPVHDPE